MQMTIKEHATATTAASTKGKLLSLLLFESGVPELLPEITGNAN